MKVYTNFNKYFTKYHYYEHMYASIRKEMADEAKILYPKYCKDENANETINDIYIARDINNYTKPIFERGNQLFEYSVMEGFYTFRNMYELKEDYADNKFYINSDDVFKLLNMKRAVYPARYLLCMYKHTVGCPNGIESDIKPEVENFYIEYQIFKRIFIKKI